MEEEPSEVAVVQILVNWINHEILWWHGWPDSTETHITALKSTGILLFTSVTSHFNLRTSGVWYHQKTREFPLKQKLNLYQVGDPIKRHTDLFKYRYINCVELAIFIGKDSVQQKLNF